MSTYEINFADSKGEFIDMDFIDETNDSVAIEKATEMANKRGCEVLDIRKIIYKPSSKTEVGSATKVTASTSDDQVIWDSQGSADYWYYDASDDEVKSTYEDIIGIDDEENIPSISEMRDELASNEYEFSTDLDDLIYNVIPEIEKQCYDYKLWLIGNYQRWDGGHNALGYFDDIESGIKDTCFPNYDSHSKLLNVDGELVFTESHHDAPMGGTLMTFYSFKDQEAFDKADLDQEETQATGSNWWGNVEYSAEDPDTVKSWIDNGWLTPVDANKLFK